MVAGQTDIIDHIYVYAHKYPVYISVRVCMCVYD